MSYKKGDIVVVKFPFVLKDGSEIQKGHCSKQTKQIYPVKFTIVTAKRISLGPNRPERPDKPDRQNELNRLNGPDQREKPNRPEKPEKPEKPD
jgi:hypothetical protein